MATPQEFGKAVLIMQADDAALAATLKKNESLVQTSVDKMQGKINTLALGQANLAASVSVAAAAVSALGAAASATGNQALATAATIATFAVALGAMATSAIAAKVSIDAMRVASLRFIKTPFGIALAAIAALAGTAAILLSRYTSRQEELTEASREASEAIARENEVIGKQGDALERQIKLLGGAKASDLESNARLRNLLIEKESLEVAIKIRTAAEAAEKALSNRIAALEKETRLLAGQESVLEQIVSIDERRATAARDRAKANQEAADALRTEAAIAENLRRSQGFLTPGEARDRVNLAATEQAGALERQRALRAALADRFNLGLQFKLAELDTQQRKLAEALGLRGGGGDPRQTQRGGAIASTAFTTGNAGLFASIQAPDPAETKRNRESTETAKSVRETAKNTKRIALLMGTTGGIGP